MNGTAIVRGTGVPVVDNSAPTFLVDDTGFNPTMDDVELIKAQTDKINFGQTSDGSTVVQTEVKKGTFKVPDGIGIIL